MDAFESSLNDLLVDTFNSILRLEEQSLRSIGDTPVTVSEAHILEAIGRLEEATVGQIATTLGVAAPTVTVALKKLEAKGFVTKVQSAEDGRRVHVRLSHAGKGINKAHRYFHHRMVRNISREFKPAEREVLLTAVQKLSHFFKEKVTT